MEPASEIIPPPNSLQHPGPELAQSQPQPTSQTIPPMSLINDALKRANQATRSQNGSSHPEGNPADSSGSSFPPLHPVPSPPLRSDSSEPNTWWFPLILGILLTIAGFSFYQWWNSTFQPPSTAAVSATPASVPPPLPPSESASTTAPPLTGSPEPTPSNPVPAPPIAAPSLPAVQPPPAAKEITTVTTPAMPVVPAEASVSAPNHPLPKESAPPTSLPKNPFPTIKLQGIFYHPTRGTALIDGQTLAVGDSWKGTKVVEIHRSGVILEFQGTKKEFNLY